MFEQNPFTINLFINDYIEIEEGAFLLKSDLYNRFKQWAENNNNYKLSANMFSSCVFKRFHKQTPKNTKNHETNKRCWKNLKYSELISSEGVSWDE